MNFYDKLDHFEHRNRLKEGVKTNTIHVSLNFSTRDSCAPETLLQIAREYMALIGFGDQPFLVYHHYDAGHPHVHIVSTTIRANGERINTHNMGRNQSELARKFLEQKYGLIKAEESGVNKALVVPFDNTKLLYGKSETKRGIANVLQQVLPTYNYCSLPELNAVLKQFNVIADPGAKDGFIHLKKGLLYHVLDRNGNKIGVPIKASSMAGNPTLTTLEKRFEKNHTLREALKEKVQQKLASVMQNNPGSIHELSAMLLAKNVATVIRQNAEGRMYGITFVDNENKMVCNGSYLGRQYSIAGLLKQMNNQIEPVSHKIHHVAKTGLIEFNGLSAVESLMQPENEFNPTPFALKKKKRKRKR